MKYNLLGFKFNFNILSNKSCGRCKCNTECTLRADVEQLKIAVLNLRELALENQKAHDVFQNENCKKDQGSY